MITPLNPLIAIYAIINVTKIADQARIGEK